MIRVACIGALTLVCAVFLGLGEADARNGDYCRFGDRTTLLFVDRSTVYDTQDRAVFARGLGHIYSELALGERLVVRTITDEYASSRVVFDGCLPGCRDQDVGLLGSCNPQVARADALRFRNRFMVSARDILANSGNLPRSEIMMTLATAVPQYRARNLRRVYLFSDLLENGSVMPWPRILNQSSDEFVATATANNGLPNLRGVTVGVFGFGRDHTSQRHSLSPNARGQLLETWNAYFSAAGARATIDQELY